MNLPGANPAGLAAREHSHSDAHFPKFVLHAARRTSESHGTSKPMSLVSLRSDVPEHDFAASESGTLDRRYQSARLGHLPVRTLVGTLLKSFEALQAGAREGHAGTTTNVPAAIAIASDHESEHISSWTIELFRRRARIGGVGAGRRRRGVRVRGRRVISVGIIHRSDNHRDHANCQKHPASHPSVCAVPVGKRAIVVRISHGRAPSI